MLRLNRTLSFSAIALFLFAGAAIAQDAVFRSNTRLATERIRSMSATEVPPYFCTIRPIVSSNLPCLSPVMKRCQKPGGFLPRSQKRATAQVLRNILTPPATRSNCANRHDRSSVTTKHQSLKSSFPHTAGGNPGFFKYLDPRQRHAGVTGHVAFIQRASVVCLIRCSPRDLHRRHGLLVVRWNRPVLWTIGCRAY